MFYRTITVFIVLFWLTMTGLLIHQQVRPGDSALREVPIAHVVKLFFRAHPEVEFLRPQLLIYDHTLHPGKDDLSIGKVTKILPATNEQTKDHRVEFAAEFRLPVPGEKRPQRIGVDGDWETDKDFVTRRFLLEVKTHVPSELTTQVEILPMEKIAHYKVESPTGVLDEKRFPLNETGARRALAELGIEPELLPPLPAHHADLEFKTTARLAKFPVREGEIDTYLVTVESNGQTLLEGHLDQLGRIVEIKFPLLDYVLVTEDSAP